MTLEAITTQTTILREISADLETPISVYMKVRGQGASFLLESVEGGERIARYSFIGIKPKAQYIIRGNEIEILERDTSRVVKFEEDVDPTYFLQEEMSRFKFIPQAGAPRFIGGLVGYLGYEAVRHFEPTLKPQMKQAPIPDGIYLLADTVIAFDHARRRHLRRGPPQAGERPGGEGRRFRGGCKRRRRLAARPRGNRQTEKQGDQNH